MCCVRPNVSRMPCYTRNLAKEDDGDYDKRGGGEKKYVYVYVEGGGGSIITLVILEKADILDLILLQQSTCNSI